MRVITARVPDEMFERITDLEDGGGQWILKNQGRGAIRKLTADTLTS